MYRTRAAWAYSNTIYKDGLLISYHMPALGIKVMEFIVFFHQTVYENSPLLIPKLRNEGYNLASCPSFKETSDSKLTPLSFMLNQKVFFMT